MIFDTHCHYNLSPLYENWQQHWQKAQQHGVIKSIVPGTNIETSQQAIEIEVEFKEQLQDVYDSYILMTEAFVASDAEEVSRKALSVRSVLKKVDMGLLQGEAHMEWMTQIEKLNESIDQISDSKDISDQRLLFAAFNTTFHTSLKSFDLQQGTTYYQYCPMANGDEGAYWFSNEKEIANPYFGEAMLKCGETRETLDFSKR